MLYDIIASVKNKRILNRKKHVYEKNLLNDNRAVRKYNMEVAVLKKLVTVLGAFFAVPSPERHLPRRWSVSLS